MNASSLAQSVKSAQTETAIEEKCLHLRGFIHVGEVPTLYIREEERKKHQVTTQMIRYDGGEEAQVLFQTFEYDFQKVKELTAVYRVTTSWDAQIPWSRTPHLPLEKAIVLYDALEEARVWHGTPPENNRNL